MYIVYFIFIYKIFNFVNKIFNFVNKILLVNIMEPMSNIFKGKIICKCCIQRNKLYPSQNIHLIIEEKPEKIGNISGKKKALIINK